MLTIDRITKSIDPESLTPIMKVELTILLDRVEDVEIERGGAVAQRVLGEAFAAAAHRAADRIKPIGSLL